MPTDLILHIEMTAPADTVCRGIITRGHLLVTLKQYVERGVSDPYFK